MAKYHPAVDDYVVSRVRALESLLLEKGLLAPETVDRVIARYDADTGPLIGARMVARAWLDPAYRALLVADAPQAVTAFGLPRSDELRVVEDTPGVHNLVVCTLCSCYPWNVMGLPPVWYKMPPYRSRAVLEPRKLLAEMGWAIPAEREIRVWDSSAELRYMVLPEPPRGFERLDEAALASLVTRDALIGVEPVWLPDSM
jgi:nitrile hydratase subunit alpha